MDGCVGEITKISTTRYKVESTEIEEARITGRLKHSYANVPIKIANQCMKRLNAFRVGDKVKLQGRGNKLDGVVCTITKVRSENMYIVGKSKRLTEVTNGQTSANVCHMKGGKTLMTMIKRKKRRRLINRLIQEEIRASQD